MGASPDPCPAPKQEPQGPAGGCSGQQSIPTESEPCSGCRHKLLLISSHETFLAATRRAGWLTVGMGHLCYTEQIPGTPGREGRPLHPSDPSRRAPRTAVQSQHHPPVGQIPAQPWHQHGGMAGVRSHTCKMGTLTAAVTFGDKNTHLFIFMYTKDICNKCVSTGN